MNTDSPPAICLGATTPLQLFPPCQQLTVLPFVPHQAHPACYGNQMTPSGQCGWCWAVGYQPSALLSVFILSPL